MKRIIACIIASLMCAATGLVGEQWRHVILEPGSVVSAVEFDGSLWFSLDTREVIKFDTNDKGAMKYANHEIGLDPYYGNFRLFGENGDLWAVKADSSENSSLNESVYRFDGQKFSLTNSETISYYLGDAFIDWESDELKDRADYELNQKYFPELDNYVSGCQRIGDSVWLAGNRIHIYDGKNFKNCDSLFNMSIGTEPTLHWNSVSDMHIDDGGALWYLFYNSSFEGYYQRNEYLGLRKFYRDTVAVFDTTRSELISNNSEIFVDSRSRIWIIPVDKLYEKRFQIYDIKYDSWSFVDLPENYSFSSEQGNRFILETDDGVIWTGLENRLRILELCSYDNGVWRIYDLFDENASFLAPNDFFLDSNDAAIIASPKSGIWKFGSDGLIGLNSEDQDFNVTTRKLIPTRDGKTLVFQSDNLGYYFSKTFENGRFTDSIYQGIFRIKSDMRSEGSRRVHYDSSYDAWLVKLNCYSMSYFEHDCEIKIYRSGAAPAFELDSLVVDLGYDLNYFHSDFEESVPKITFDDKGILWMGLGNRLHEIDPDGSQAKSFVEFGELEVKHIKGIGVQYYHYCTNFDKIFSVPNDRIWFTYKGDLYEYDKTEIMHIGGTDINGLSFGNLNDVYFAESGDVWFSTDAGLYRRSARGDWELFFADFSELPSDKVKKVEVDSKGNVWILHGKGLSVYNRSGIVLSSFDDYEQDAQIKLSVYPNPFSQFQITNYELREAGYVTLRVIDMLGREVSTLVDGFREAGGHEARFNAAGLPSGVYLIELRGGGQILTEKIIFTN